MEISILIEISDCVTPRSDIKGTYVQLEALRVIPIVLYNWVAGSRTEPEI